jgi:hypothetical protein
MKYSQGERKRQNGKKKEKDHAPPKRKPSTKKAAWKLEGGKKRKGKKAFEFVRSG